MPVRSASSTFNAKEKGLLALMLGVGIIVLMFIIIGQETYFGANAVPGTATVLSLRQQRRARGRWVKRETYDYYVTYSFRLPTPMQGRTEVVREEIISEYDFHRLKAGQIVAVRYLPSDPTHPRLGAAMSYNIGWLGVLGGSLLAGLALLTALRYLTNEPPPRGPGRRPKKPLARRGAQK